MSLRAGQKHGTKFENIETLRHVPRTRSSRTKTLGCADPPLTLACQWLKHELRRLGLGTVTQTKTILQSCHGVILSWLLLLDSSLATYR